MALPQSDRKHSKGGEAGNHTRTKSDNVAENHNQGKGPRSPFAKRVKERPQGRKGGGERRRAQVKGKGVSWTLRPDEGFAREASRPLNLTKLRAQVPSFEASFLLPPSLRNLLPARSPSTFRARTAVRNSPKLQSFSLSQTGSPLNPLPIPGPETRRSPLPDNKPTSSYQRIMRTTLPVIWQSNRSDPLEPSPLPIPAPQSFIGPSVFAPLFSVLLG